MLIDVGGGSVSKRLHSFSTEVLYTYALIAYVNGAILQNETELGTKTAYINLIISYPIFYSITMRSSCIHAFFVKGAPTVLAVGTILLLSRLYEVVV